MSNPQAGRLAVQIAEACGWLIDADEDVVQGFLTGEDTVRPGSAKDRYLLSLIPSGVNIPSNLYHTWRIEPSRSFRQSVVKIRLTTVAMHMAQVLLDWVAQDPYNGEALSDQTYYVMRLSGVAGSGGNAPPLLLVYALVEETETVQLLALFASDDTADAVQRQIQDYVDRHLLGSGGDEEPA